MKFWQLFLISQGIAIINCINGVQIEVNNTIFNTNMPFSLSMTFYFITIFLFITKEARKKLGWRNELWCLLFVVLDICSNVCISYSYGYTNIISVILLTSLSTPFAMFFSYFILKTRYQMEQLMSALVSLIIATTYVLLDKEQEASRLYGNLLAILGGGIGYGITTTINELILRKNISQYAIMARLGSEGFVLASILVLSIERKQYATIPKPVFGIFFAYGFGMMSFYLLQMYAIKVASAVFFNISTLLTNFYTFFISAFGFKTSFSMVQIIPGILLIFTLIIYDIFESGKILTKDKPQKQIKITETILMQAQAKAE